MNEKLSTNRGRFADRAEVGKVYDIEVVGGFVYRDVLCVPNKYAECSGCCLRDSGLICALKSDGYVCGNGKFIPLSEILEDL